MAIDTYRTRLAHGEEITFTQPRWKMFLFFLLCLVFTLIGVAMIVSGDGLKALIGGILAVLFFGLLGIPMTLLRTIRPSPQLKVSAEKGVWLQQGDASWVSWQQIREVQLGEVSGQKMVVLGVDPELYERRFAESSAVSRGMSSANESILGGPGLAIPTSLSIKPKDLATWLAAERDQRGALDPRH